MDSLSRAHLGAPFLDAVLSAYLTQLVEKSACVEVGDVGKLKGHHQTSIVPESSGWMPYGFSSAAPEGCAMLQTRGPVGRPGGTRILKGAA
jgi:hypothetical protein